MLNLLKNHCRGKEALPPLPLMIRLFSKRKATPAEPDHAWKVLSITNDWIRHADAKCGVTLAFVGVTGTTLFNLVKDEKAWSLLLNIAVFAGITSLVTAVVFAGLALFPRTATKENRQKFWKRRTGKASGTSSPASVKSAQQDQINLLFFGHVAAHYRDDGPSYQEVLGLITKDRERLTTQIASQIHENSHVAVLKFKYVNRAIMAELAAIVSLVFALALVITGA